MRKEAEQNGENLSAKNGQFHASFQDHDLPPKNGPPRSQSIRAFAPPRWSDLELLGQNEEGGGGGERRTPLDRRFDVDKERDRAAKDGELRPRIQGARAKRRKGEKGQEK